MEHYSDNRLVSARLSFFDLPREVRDLIYLLTVNSIETSEAVVTHVSATKDCLCLEATSVHPPKFGGMRGLSKQDRWLAAVSLVSKQFSSEMRLMFFRSCEFTIREPLCSPNLDACSLSKFHAFLRALGTEAQDLRRMRILCNTMSAVYPTDVELALRGCMSMINPRALILLEVTQMYVRCPLFGNRKVSNISCRVGEDGSITAVEVLPNFNDS